MSTVRESLVTIACYSFLHEAHLAKVQLELAGIPVFLADKHINSLRGGIPAFGVRVQVSDSMAVAARKILSAQEGSQPTTDEGPAVCPNCGSIRTSESWGRFAYLMTMLFFGLPTLSPAKRMHCKGCGHRWKSR